MQKWVYVEDKGDKTMLEEYRITDDGVVTYDKIKVAIERFQMFESLALEINPRGYCVTDSGGKDSSVIKKLAELSGVKYIVRHSHTTLDHPETVYFIRREKARLKAMGIDYEIIYPKKSFYRLALDYMMLPTRHARYCCSVLKENNNRGYLTVTGVRRAESKQRSTRGMVETMGSTKKKAIILMNDNDEARKEFETCTAKEAKILNPIIDWTDADVWDFIQQYDLPVNPLYSMGYKRVGCIGCPMASTKERRREYAEMPKYRESMIRLCGRIIAKRIAENKPVEYADGISYFKAWMAEWKTPDNCEQIKMEITN